MAIKITTLEISDIGNYSNKLIKTFQNEKLDYYHQNSLLIKNNFSYKIPNTFDGNYKTPKDLIEACKKNYKISETTSYFINYLYLIYNEVVNRNSDKRPFFTEESILKVRNEHFIGLEVFVNNSSARAIKDVFSRYLDANPEDKDDKRDFIDLYVENHTVTRESLLGDVFTNTAVKRSIDLAVEENPEIDLEEAYIKAKSFYDNLVRNPSYTRSGYSNSSKPMGVDTIFEALLRVPNLKDSEDTKVPSEHTRESFLQRAESNKLIRELISREMQEDNPKRLLATKNLLSPMSYFLSLVEQLRAFNPRHSLVEATQACIELIEEDMPLEDAARKSSPVNVFDRFPSNGSYNAEAKFPPLIYSVLANNLEPSREAYKTFIKTASLYQQGEIDTWDNREKQKLLQFTLLYSAIASEVTGLEPSWIKDLL